MAHHTSTPHPVGRALHQVLSGILAGVLAAGTVTVSLGTSKDDHRPPDRWEEAHSQVHEAARDSYRTQISDCRNGVRRLEARMDHLQGLVAVHGLSGMPGMSGPRGNNHMGNVK